MGCRSQAVSAPCMQTPMRGIRPTLRPHSVIAIGDHPPGYVVDEPGGRRCATTRRKRYLPTIDLPDLRTTKILVIDLQTCATVRDGEALRRHCCSRSRTLTCTSSRAGCPEHHEERSTYFRG